MTAEVWHPRLLQMHVFECVWLCGKTQQMFLLLHSTAHKHTVQQNSGESDAEFYLSYCGSYRETKNKEFIICRMIMDSGHSKALLSVTKCYSSPSGYTVKYF